MGQSGAWISDVIFKNGRVPATSIIGGIEGRGFATAMKSLDRGRINVACVAVGQARRILYEATRYAADREQFGEPIGHYQLVQAMLADSRSEEHTSELPSLMRISYAVFCLKKKRNKRTHTHK